MALGSDYGPQFDSRWLSFLFLFIQSGWKINEKIELEAACPHHPKIDLIEKGSDQNSVETLEIIPEKIEFEDETPEKIETEKMDIENSVQPLDDSPSRWLKMYAFVEIWLPHLRIMIYEKWRFMFKYK